MRVKLDENVPVALVELFTAAGHRADTVPQEELTGQHDSCQQDLDFSDARQFAPGTHHGLLLIRLSNPSRRPLIERVRHILVTNDIERWKGCFVVATDRKLRVRWPTVT